MTSEEKRQHLEWLLDEHLLVQDAYRQKADQTQRVVDMLASTKEMLLAELLVAREVDGQAETPEEHRRLEQRLYQRVFEAATITVWNEAHAALKTAARRVAPHDIERIAAGLDSQPLAEGRGFSVSVGTALRHYARTPPDQRPDVAREQGLVALLKEVLKDDLLAAEARARGLEESTEFRERVQLNRNALVRMWAQDRVSQEATARMQAPDIDARVRQWYRENLERLYTVRDDAGRERRLSLEEEEERIRNDYADHLREKVRAERARALRGVHKIVVDEQVLAKS